MRMFTIVVLALASVTLAAGDDIKLVANGRLITSEPAPMMHEGHVYVPLRAAAEAVGGEVKYDAASKTVTICRGGVCSFIRQSDGITVNNRLLVGIRQVAEAVDVKVDWDAAARTVRLTTKPPAGGS
ncbi:MAG: copper amine oxidase N-terminal domain-containing protein [Armatimonadetes bacterium]|nr:copper amine oxidase N-terminal domain-containing protein [Armatimonadota bacterium]